MCRSILTLRGPSAPPDPDIEAAARQFVRKVSGSRTPSQANEQAFSQAIAEITASTQRLLDVWVSPATSR
jgi:hypothetical protein